MAREYRGESIEKYKFVNPEITDLTPSSGPRSGGTLLHIIGHHMNAGSRIEAFISDRPCEIQRCGAYCRKLRDERDGLILGFENKKNSFTLESI